MRRLRLASLLFLFALSHRIAVAGGSLVPGIGTAQSRVATGPVTSTPPVLTPDQLAARQRQLAHVNLPIPFTNPGPGTPPPIRGPISAPTSASAQNSGAPKVASTDFVVQTTHRFTAAEAPLTSVVSEPSLGSMGNTIFYSANWYAARSTDGGASFSYVDPFLLFPSVNGGFCCDQVVNYAPSQDMILWSLLYASDGASSTVRLAAAAGSAAVAGNTWTYWDFNPQMFGFASGYWFDFPNLTVGSTFAYLTANVFSTSNSAFVASVIWRIPLAQLAAGGSVTFSYLQQSNIAGLRCTEGATTTMYWAVIFLGNYVMRIYHWDDSSNTIFWDDKTLSAFTYLNQDGVATSPDGTNWAANADSRIYGAWVANGVIGFMFPAKQDSTFPYPYTIVARFNQSTRALLTQTQIWNSAYAWLYPSAGVNAAGNLAGVIYWGGGSTYPNAAAWINDDIQTGFAPLPNYGLASSNAGPLINRWGDFSTTRQNRLAGNSWVAGVYYLNGGGSDSNVVEMFVAFGRARDICGSLGGASLIAPSGGVTGNLPTFSWNPSIGASNYYLALLKTADVLTSPNPVPQILGPAPNTSFTPSSMIPNGDYVWGVVPTNSACATTGSLQGVKLFTLNASCPLSAPSLLRPAYGSAVFNPVQFSWSSVPGATVYVPLAVNSTGQLQFSPLVAGTTYSPSHLSTGLADWAAVSWNSTCGVSPLSAVFPFTVAF